MLSLAAACGFGIILVVAWLDSPRQWVLAQAGPGQTAPVAPQPAPSDGKLRIIIFGAHPDDAEYRGAGVAMKWAKAGHHVKLVSATNGDIGHWQTPADRSQSDARPK